LVVIVKLQVRRTIDDPSTLIEPDTTLPEISAIGSSSQFKEIILAYFFLFG